mmetsp:Transcript_28295/g.56550  ORF Transcript_28295/g.56550 Transcript_28295/m.56550 type:complete len:305 (-) Transcript_28295:95-1009(-)
MPKPDVNIDSLATFMKWRMKCWKRSFGMPSASSSSLRYRNNRWSSSWVNSSSAFSPSLGSGFLQDLKKASHSASLMLPSLPVSIASNSWSAVCSALLLWYLRALRARPSRAEISRHSRRLASSRSLAHADVALMSRASHSGRRTDSFCSSLPNHNFSSAGTSSPTLAMVFLASAMDSRISFTTLSSSSALAAKDAAVAWDLSALAAASPSASALTAVFSISAISSAAALRRWLYSSFCAASFLSFSSRASRRTLSFAISRWMPTRTFSLWNWFFVMPLAPESTKESRMTSRAGAGISNLNSPLA